MHDWVNNLLGDVVEGGGMGGGSRVSPGNRNKSATIKPNTL